MTYFPFTGSIEFQLSIKALGVSVVRQAHLDYAYVPDWSYFDLQAGDERTGVFQLDARLRVLARPQSGTSPGKRSARRSWAPVSQLLTTGVLSKRFADQLRRQVDAETRGIDRRNRLRAGWPTPSLPNKSDHPASSTWRTSWL
ncbi:MAG: hypothetical protein GEV13_35410 [Rhodospirillales bacterium]|nr:hypothetical protein [Rhodospirillales bacterium]